MLKHEISPQSIFETLRHFLSRMPDTSLLKNQNSPQLGLNIDPLLFVHAINPCGTSLYALLPKIYLKRYSGLASIRELKLAITMTSKEIPGTIAQVAEALINPNVVTSQSMGLSWNKHYIPDQLPNTFHSARNANNSFPLSSRFNLQKFLDIREKAFI